MATTYIAKLASQFPAKQSNENAVWDTEAHYSGFYIGENIIITCAHGLFDVRRLTNPNPNYNWHYTAASNSGTEKTNGSILTASSTLYDSNFLNFLNTDFSANINPYADPSIVTVDRGLMVVTDTLATNKLLGAGVFLGPSSATTAAVGASLKMYSRNGTVSGTIANLNISGGSVRASYSGQAGDSGSGMVTSYRTVSTSQTYVIATDSLNSNGATGALRTPSWFYSIMSTLASGKVGLQSAQPTNYIHGSDSAESVNGTFRPDVIYGNQGNDTIDDGDIGQAYWADDYLFGGPGDDILKGGRGNDLLHGGDRLSPTGGSVSNSNDGNDIADYGGQFSGTNGIDILVDNTVYSSIYQTMPYFNTAVFVKDKTSGDYDTLISIETVRGSSGSDTASIDSLTNGKTSSQPGVGLLHSIEFNANKSSTEIDTLDLSGMDAGVLLNLGNSAFVTDPNRLPYRTDYVTIPANTVERKDGQGSQINVINPNYIVGTNSVHQADNHYDDILVGGPNPDTFEATLGFDEYDVGAGDTITLPQFANKSRSQVTSTDIQDKRGYDDEVWFNGLQLDSMYPVGHDISQDDGLYYDFDSPTPMWSLQYDTQTMTAVVTDLRDNSTMTIDNYLPTYLGIKIFAPNGASSASQINQPSASPVTAELYDKSTISPIGYSPEEAGLNISSYASRFAEALSAFQPQDGVALDDHRRSGGLADYSMFARDGIMRAPTRGDHLSL